MDPVLINVLVGLFAALLGSGGATAHFLNRRLRKTEATTANIQAGVSQQAANDSTMLSFYALWTEELERLRKDIDRLHALVGALEHEIISLGGDPVRVRLELAKELTSE